MKTIYKQNGCYNCEHSITQEYGVGKRCRRCTNPEQVREDGAYPCVQTADVCELWTKKEKEVTK